MSLHILKDEMLLFRWDIFLLHRLMYHVVFSLSFLPFFHAEIGKISQKLKILKTLRFESNCSFNHLNC